MQVVVRARNDPTALAPTVRAALHEADPDIVIENVASMQQRIARTLAPRRFSMTIVGGLGLLTTLLAGIGLYGLIAVLVAERRLEVGIRVALGASRTQIESLVLRRGGRLVALGLVIGIPAALAATRLLRGLLYDVPSTDPVSFAAAAGVLAAVALLASWLPARRAGRRDPLRALGGE
jgi:putative ABC transport system permease protein